MRRPTASARFPTRRTRHTARIAVRMALALGVAGACLLPAVSRAQPYPYPGIDPPFGPYIGGTIGGARDGGDYGSAALVDRTGLALKAIFGYRANPWFGVEIGFVSLPSTRTEVATFGGGGRQVTYNHDAVPLVLAGFLPVTPVTELTGRFGLLLDGGYRGDRVCVDANGRSYYCSSTPLTWGAGLRVAMPRGLGIRIDYDFYQIDDGADAPRARMSMLSIGLDYRF